MRLTSKHIKYTVDTVDELLSLVGEEDATVVVTEEGRGGLFIYRGANSARKDGGTIFNGWTRDYSGAVNVKWFETVQKAINVGVGVILEPRVTYTISSPLILNGEYFGSIEGRSRAIIKQSDTFTGDALLVNYDGSYDGTNIPTSRYVNIHNIGIVVESGIDGISLISQQESSHISNIIVNTTTTTNKGYPIKYRTTSVDEGSMNVCYIDNITVYGGGWEGNLYAVGSGNGIRVNKFITTNSPVRGNSFHLSLIDVSMDNIHIESIVDNSHHLVYSECRELSVSNSFVMVNDSNIGSVFKSFNPHDGGYQYSPMSLSNISIYSNDFTLLDNTPFIIDYSLPTVNKTINFLNEGHYIKRLNTWDGTFLSYVNDQNSGIGEKFVFIYDTDDKYLVDEGMFLPIIYGGTDTGTQSYTTQLGSYRRSGNTMMVSIRLEGTFTVAPTGKVLIGGLPEVCKTTASILEIPSIGYGYMVSGVSGFILRDRDYIELIVNSSSITSSSGSCTFGSEASDTNFKVLITLTYQL